MRSLSGPPGPPPCLPSAGSAEKLRSSQVWLLPHSRAWLGATRLAPGNTGAASLRLDPKMPVPAAWNCPWGDRPAGRDGAGAAAEVQGAQTDPTTLRDLSGAPRWPQTRPSRPASTALAPASRGGGSRGRDSGRSGRGWDSWSALDAPFTNAHSSPDSAQLEAPGVTTEAERTEETSEIPTHLPSRA